MNAKKLPSGNYRVRLFLGSDASGKHYKSFTAPTKKQAELMALQYRTDNEVKDLSFKKAMNMYIKERENVLSPASIKKYRSLERSEYLEPILDMDINKIKTEHIQNLVNKMLLTCSVKTTSSMYGFIAGILKRFGCRENINVTLPKKERSQLYLPSDDDIKKLYETAKGTSLEIPIYLATIGCMRRAEICAFDKSDLNENRLHIHRAMVLNDKGSWVVKTPKTYKGDRFIELPEFLVEKINNMPSDNVGLTPNSITNRFPRILKKAGLPKFKFHNLRAYGASVLSKMGVNTYTIMSICGWESERMLNEIYRYQFNDEISAASRLQERHFSTMICPKDDT